MCQKIHLRVQKEKIGKLTLKSCFFYSFSTKSRQTWNFGGKLSARCLKLLRTCPSEKKIRKNIFGQLISLQFWKLTRKNLDFTGKNYGWGVKTKFNMSRGTLTEYCFWKKVLKVSGFLDEKWRFLDSDEQFSSRLPKLKKKVPRNNLMKILSQEGNTHQIFRALSELFFFLLLAENFTRIVKIASYLALEGFE